MTSYETTEQILDTLRSAEQEISTQQLLDWSRQGLIPRAQQTGLGRGQGSQTRFPIGTCKQVYALVQIRRFTGRNLDHAGWMLWIHGFEVADKYWKKPFADASNELFKVIQYATDKELLKDQNEISISEEAIITLEEIARGRNKSEFFGPIRRSIGRNNYVIFLRIIFEVILGIFDPSGKSETDPNFAHELRDILRKVIEGTHEQTSIIITKVLAEFSISEAVFAEMLGELSNEFLRYRSVQMLETFSHEDLLVGRNETVFLLGSFDRVANSLETKPRALELLQRLLESLTAKQHASMIFLWLIARRIPSVSAGLQKLPHVADSQKASL